MCLRRYILAHPAGLGIKTLSRLGLSDKLNQLVKQDMLNFMYGVGMVSTRSRPRSRSRCSSSSSSSSGGGGGAAAAVCGC
jgi:hypothetical protein